MKSQKKIYPEQFTRSFKPLGSEIKEIISLALPRFGHSPRVAFLTLTNACQMDCSYCNIRSNIRKAKSPGLKTPELFKMLDNLAKARIQMVTFSGGEPTLRQDLPKLIFHSKKLGMQTVLCTNGGINKDYEYWYNLAESGLFGATFSYDGVGEKNDTKIIHLAAFLVNQLHIYSGIRMVVWHENLDKVYKTAKICMLNNIFFQAVPAVALDGETSASATDFTSLDSQERKELAKILYEVSKIRGPFANFLRMPKSYLREVVASPNPNSWHCKNPSSHWISVDARGNARICTDVALKGKTYSLTGEENPLLTKEFYEDVDRQSINCAGCSWYSHWDGNRGQVSRGLDQLRLVLTIGGYT